jgi:hypothetical protein
MKTAVSHAPAGKEPYSRAPWASATGREPATPSSAPAPEPNPEHGFGLLRAPAQSPALARVDLCSARNFEQTNSPARAKRLYHPPVSAARTRTLRPATHPSPKKINFGYSNPDPYAPPASASHKVSVRNARTVRTSSRREFHILNRLA